MRRHGRLAVGTAAALMVLATTGTAQAGGGDREVIRAQDDCDPATFPVFDGEPVCAPGFDGDTTLAEFLEELDDEGEVGAWRFRPEDTKVDHGTPVVVKNEGGEAHSFTRVKKFGPGCVAELNRPEDAVPVDECAPPPDSPDSPPAWLGTIIPPGESMPVTDLRHGVNRYECLIHPWMRTVIHVEHDHD